MMAITTNSSIRVKPLRFIKQNLQGKLGTVKKDEKQISKRLISNSKIEELNNSNKINKLKRKNKIMSQDDILKENKSSKKSINIKKSEIIHNINRKKLYNKSNRILI